MSKKFIDLANLKSNLENFLSEIITPTFATKEAVTGQLGNHTVKSDVPENAVFTDTVYDDAEVQKRISDNGYGEVVGGKNLLNPNKFLKWVNQYTNGRYSNDEITISPVNVYLYNNFFKFSDTDIDVTLSIKSLTFENGSNPRVCLVNSAGTIIGTVTTNTPSASGLGCGIKIDFTDLPTSITIKELMIEEGSVATEYEPYFPSNKMLAEDVANVKNDLNNYALKSLYGDTTINVGRLANSAVGNHSTAEGNNTTASGESSHAEGSSTTASGFTSHAEGSETTASGSASHAEGEGTTASGDYSHAEGKNTTASASYTHSEGVNTSAIGQGSHAEGSNLEQNRYNEIVFEEPRRVEIEDVATGDFITITVAGSQAFGLNSHAEGCSTLAYGKNSHTEGYHTFAAENESHAEGCGCEANNAFAHAEGQDTRADGRGAHAEGFGTTARGTSSHAEGFSTTASGTYSHAEGYYTKAANYASHASGKYNAAMTTGGGASNTIGTAFVIGNGTSPSALSNAFSVQFDGTVKAKSTITASTTADYAEFFEWLDKNPNEEDRVGHFVTLDGDKIKIATNEDDYILGIVSGEPFVLGNGDCDTWNGMFLHDEFRRTMYEPAPKMIEILDSEGNPTGKYEEVEGEYEGTRPVLNPEYDPTQEYISRFDRVEWSPIGMLGVLAVLHDGTAEVNGYVTVNNEGIATKCTRDTRNSYRVIKKVSDKVVEVIFR